MKDLPYNTYIKNGRPTEMYGQKLMTTKTYADTQAVNLLSTDTMILTLLLTMTGNHHLTSKKTHTIKFIHNPCY